jgi:hypothetical protein
VGVPAIVHGRFFPKISPRRNPQHSAPPPPPEALPDTDTPEV